MTYDLFAPAAERELLTAVTWMAGNSEERAAALLDAALRSARRIARHPMAGRSRPELAPAPYRFWRVAGFPYLVVYNSVRRPPRVVRFVHMARDLPPLLGGLAAAEEDQ